MPHQYLLEYIAHQKPIYKAVGDWGKIQLDVSYFLCDETPPAEYISSVRAIVFKGNEVLIVDQGNGNFSAIPGGRREGEESLEETVRREVAEETGWAINNLKLFAFGHLKHTTPEPEGYRYPYPHFLWLIYTAEAVDFDGSRMFSPEDLAAEYVADSHFMPIEQALPLLSERDQILIRTQCSSPF